MQTTAEAFHQPERKSAEIAMGGSSIEAIGGIAAVVLAIIGLAGLLPVPLAAIAVIAVGIAFVSQSAAIFARYSEMLTRAARGVFGSLDFGSGATTEFVGGFGGIVLGILALLRISPPVLIATAVIAYGTTLLLSSGETSRVSSVTEGEPPELVHQITSFISSAAAGGQVLIGLGAIVLGILALVMGGPTQQTLFLVGLLCVGASLLFSGSALASRMLTLMHPAAP